jgi:hypothetical protein
MPRPIDSLPVFLAHALAIEREAADRHAQLAAWFGTRGEQALAGLCGERAQAARSQCHMLARAAEGLELAIVRDGEYGWPRSRSGEAAPCPELITMALEAERRARRFLGWVARTTRERHVRALARELASEAASHVARLESAVSHRLPGEVPAP